MHSITKKDLEFIINSTHDGTIAVNGEGYKIKKYEIK